MCGSCMHGMMVSNMDPSRSARSVAASIVGPDVTSLNNKIDALNTKIDDVSMDVQSVKTTLDEVARDEETEFSDASADDDEDEEEDNTAVTGPQDLPGRVAACMIFTIALVFALALLLPGIFKKRSASTAA